jgi:hypothetical protein
LKKSSDSQKLWICFDRRKDKTPRHKDSGEGKSSTDSIPSRKDSILGETITLDP